MVSIPPSQLTDEQRQRVQAHLRLVYLQLRRRHRPGRIAADDDDLIQEGCIALAEAVRRHDPARHGSFAPYALARINCAMGLWVAERRGLIRVPSATQKRRRRRLRDAARHDPDRPAVEARGPATPTDATHPSARVVSFPAGGLPVRRRSSPPTDGSGPTIGELLRERIERALSRAAADVRRTARRACAGVLIDRIVAERLSVPDPDEQTPLRALMRDAGVSIGCAFHTELRLIARARRRLLRDRVFRLLRRFARRDDDGTAQPLDAAGAELVRRALARDAAVESAERGPGGRDPGRRWNRANRRVTMSRTPGAGRRPPSNRGR